MLPFVFTMRRRADLALSKDKRDHGVTMNIDHHWLMIWKINRATRERATRSNYRAWRSACKLRVWWEGKDIETVFLSNSWTAARAQLQHVPWTGRSFRAPNPGIPAGSDEILLSLSAAAYKNRGTDEMDMIEQDFDLNSSSAFRAQAVWFFHVPWTCGIWVIRAMNGQRWMARGGERPRWVKLPGKSVQGVVS